MMSRTSLGADGHRGQAEREEQKIEESGFDLVSRDQHGRLRIVLHEDEGLRFAGEDHRVAVDGQVVRADHLEARHRQDRPEEPLGELAPCLNGQLHDRCRERQGKRTTHGSRVEGRRSELAADVVRVLAEGRQERVVGGVRPLRILRWGAGGGGGLGGGGAHGIVYTRADGKGRISGVREEGEVDCGSEERSSGAS